MNAVEATHHSVELLIVLMMKKFAVGCLQLKLNNIRKDVCLQFFVHLRIKFYMQHMLIENKTQTKQAKSFICLSKFQVLS